MSITESKKSALDNRVLEAECPNCKQLRNFTFCRGASEAWCHFCQHTFRIVNLDVTGSVPRATLERINPAVVAEAPAPTDTDRKYLRTISSRDGSASIEIDVYNVLVAYRVTCPARAHAIKKLLCAGLRGKGDVLQELTETLDAVRRAIDLTKGQP